MEIIIPKIYFEYAAKAASTDSHRPILTGLCLCTWKGFVWLMATDVHRIHAIRLKDSAEEDMLQPLPGWNKGMVKDPEDWIPHLVFPARRILFELKYWKHDFVRIEIEHDTEIETDESFVGSRFSVGYIRNLAKPPKSGRSWKPTIETEPEYVWEPITHPETLEGNYPSLGRVLNDEGEGAFLESLCINSKYLADAASIADLATREGGGRKIVIAPTQSGRLEETCRPIYVKPCKKPVWESSWFALIMPMKALDKEFER